MLMPQGSIDLFTLLIIFLVLQALWIYPIFQKSKILNKKEINLKEKIKKLERLYKK